MPTTVSASLRSALLAGRVDRKMLRSLGASIRDPDQADISMTLLAFRIESTSSTYKPGDRRAERPSFRVTGPLPTFEKARAHGRF
jgi:hypothetical protein